MEIIRYMHAYTAAAAADVYASSNFHFLMSLIIIAVIFKLTSLLINIQKRKNNIKNDKKEEVCNNV